LIFTFDRDGASSRRDITPSCFISPLSFIIYFLYRTPVTTTIVPLQNGVQRYNVTRFMPYRVTPSAAAAFSPSIFRLRRFVSSLIIYAAAAAAAVSL